MEKKYLNEAPDEFGILTDDELEAELERERQELEAKHQARKAAAQAARAEQEAKAKEEAERKSRVEAIMNEILKDTPREEVDIEFLFDKLVPSSGPAETMAGELVRAMMRILYRDYNDGDVFYAGYGLETCAPALCFIVKHASPKFEELALDIMENTLEGSAYTDAIEEMAFELRSYLLDEAPELFAEENKHDIHETDVSFVEDNMPLFDYSCEIPDELEAHLDKGNIDNSDVEWFIDDCIRSYGDRVTWEINCYSWEVEITGLPRDIYDDIEGHVYDWLTQYAEELTDEYGNPYINYDVNDLTASELVPHLRDYCEELHDEELEEELIVSAADLMIQYYERKGLYDGDYIDLEDFDNIDALAEHLVDTFIGDYKWDPLFDENESQFLYDLFKEHDEIEEELLQEDAKESFESSYDDIKIIQSKEDKAELASITEIIDLIILDEYFMDGELKSIESVWDGEDNYFIIKTRDGKKNGTYKYADGVLFMYDEKLDEALSDDEDKFTEKHVSIITTALRKHKIKDAKVTISNNGYSLDIDFPDITRTAERFYDYLVDCGVDCDLHDEDDNSWIAIYNNTDLNYLD